MPRRRDHCHRFPTPKAAGHGDDLPDGSPDAGLARSSLRRRPSSHMIITDQGPLCACKKRCAASGVPVPLDPPGAHTAPSPARRSGAKRTWPHVAGTPATGGLGTRRSAGCPRLGGRRSGTGAPARGARVALTLGRSDGQRPGARWGRTIPAAGLPLRVPVSPDVEISRKTSIDSHRSPVPEGRGRHGASLAGPRPSCGMPDSAMPLGPTPHPHHAHPQ